MRDHWTYSFTLSERKDRDGDADVKGWWQARTDNASLLHSPEICLCFTFTVLFSVSNCHAKDNKKESTCGFLMPGNITGHIRETKKKKKKKRARKKEDKFFFLNDACEGSHLNLYLFTNMHAHVYTDSHTFSTQLK